MNRAFPDPRPILSQHPSMNLSSPTAFVSPRNQSESPPFEDQETLIGLKQEDGTPIAVNIDCRIEKGFFISSDNCWTCYRRNYFSVICSYALQPLPCGRPVYLVRNGKMGRAEQVQAMAVCLSAVVDGTAGKAVELVQHTPKRDRGPQKAVEKTKIMPKLTPDARLPHELSPYPMSFSLANQHPQIALPNFPLQQAPDFASNSSDDGVSGGSQFPGNNTSPTAQGHTFERIQFKSATANNGKRRAQQQYYHLIVELWADVRISPSAQPEWIKVAQRLSSQVVVRGRSPSHYHNEGPSSVTRGVPGFDGNSPTGNQWGPSALSPPSMPTYSPAIPRYLGAPSSHLTYGMSAHSHPHHHHHHHHQQDDHTTGGSGLLHMSDSGHVDSLRNLHANEPSHGYHYIANPLLAAGLASPSVKAMVKSETKAMEDHGPGSMSANNCRMVGLDSSRTVYQYANVGHDSGY
jgi:meiosis-specific transcription factor NDT80